MRRVDNPPNRYHDTHVVWDEGEGPDAELEVHEEQARSILAENDSPDIPFRWSLNPYRGCVHACAYCYARPSHQQLGFGAGTDFDRKIVVKTNAPALLREAFERRTWRGEAVMLSGNTDCYQPLEGRYALTRACLEVFAAYRNPVTVITKGALVARDVDLLAELARHGAARVYLSVGFLDDEVRRKVEPWASPVARRFEAIRRLADAGVPCGVSLSPVIPGLNDGDAAGVLTRAWEAGARRAFMTPLRLPGEVAAVYDARMAEAFPHRVRRMDSALVQVRRGRRDERAFGARMTGEGPRWDIVKQVFDVTCRRLGMNAPEAERPSPFRRPTAQGSLFE